MYLISKKKNECTGCTACFSACGQGAISMQYDEEGFCYPHIDQDKCIECNLCKKVCPCENKEIENRQDPIAYASFLKSEEQRVKSTSGGVFYAIASQVIARGGIVYGAALDEEFKLKHIGIQSMDELQRLRGSKYVQSELGFSFKEIKQLLGEGRLVYFVGTGCQVAGLKMFLRKDYKNLITSDLVCHGVPSQKIFDAHIKYIEKKYKKRVIDYKFRDYAKGQGGEFFELLNGAKTKVVKKPSYELSPYLYSFMYGLTFRFSCYNCQFACCPRVGDITLADFWGVKEFLPEIDDSKGVSLILVNNEKGKSVVSAIKEECVLYKSSIKDAVKYNSGLVQPSAMPPNREDIYKTLSKYGYEKLAKQEFRSPNYLKIKIYYLMHSNRFLSKTMHILHGLKKCILFK